ncbi:MAG: VOC family protein [Actinomycetota bacterium]
MSAFEQLRIDDARATRPPVDPAFARRLRATLETAPHTTDSQQPTDVETTMTSTDTPPSAAPSSDGIVPASTMITPYLAVEGAAQAIEWYRTAFDATEELRFTGDDGRIGHAEVSIFGARVMLSDSYPEVGAVAPTADAPASVSLHIEVPDCDTTFRRAVDAGARGDREPSDQGHGSRSATITDPFGHRWMLNQTLTQLSAAEMNERYDDFDVT